MILYKEGLYNFNHDMNFDMDKLMRRNRATTIRYGDFNMEITFYSELFFVICIMI